MSSKRERDVEHDDSPNKKNPRISDPTIDLPQLLDFTSLTTVQDIQHRFDHVAQALLHEFFIVVSTSDPTTTETKTECYEILELEFYLQKPDCHDDPFTHGSEEQKRSGQWYFHRAPRSTNLQSTTPTGYRGGSRKGLDLTIGSPVYAPSSSSVPAPSSDNATIVRGGALLRTLRRVSDNSVICGPSLLVDEILRVSDASGVSQLVEDKWQGDISAFPKSTSTGRTSSMCLRPRTSVTSVVAPAPAPVPAPATKTTQTTLTGTLLRTRPSPAFFRSSRIGLDLSNPETTESLTHPRVVFVSKPYRYFTNPELLIAKGRGHTFLGVYRSCLDLARDMDDGKSRSDNTLLADLVHFTGMKVPIVNKYLADYRSGLSRGKLKGFIGHAGKGASSSPSTYLKMMGTLQRVMNQS